MQDFVEAYAEAVRYTLDHGFLSLAAFDIGILAMVLIDLGRLDDAAEAVADGLGLVGEYRGTVNVRLAAGQLAVRTRRPRGGRSTFRPRSGAGARPRVRTRP